MVASNLQIRTSANDAMNALVDKSESNVMMQTLSNIAIYGGNVKIKSFVLESLSGKLSLKDTMAERNGNLTHHYGMIVVVERGYSPKSIAIAKYVIPCCVKLFSDNRTEIRTQNKKLLKKLYSLMGDELIDAMIHTGLPNENRTSLIASLK